MFNFVTSWTGVTETHRVLFKQQESQFEFETHILNSKHILLMFLFQQTNLVFLNRF
jgi:hypothetical protein